MVRTDDEGKDSLKLQFRITEPQWLAYLRDTDTESVSSARLQALSSSPCLDADALLQEGSRVSLQAANGQLQLELANLDSMVSVGIDTTTATTRLPGLGGMVRHQ